MLLMTRRQQWPGLTLDDTSTQPLPTETRTPVLSDLSAGTSPPSIILEAGRAEQHYWRDIWAYRELFAILAWRDVAVRYKQTIIGILWAIVRPLITMVVFVVVFNKLAKLPS